MGRDPPLGDLFGRNVDLRVTNFEVVGNSLNPAITSLVGDLVYKVFTISSGSTLLSGFTVVFVRSLFVDVAVLASETAPLFADVTLFVDVASLV